LRAPEPRLGFVLVQLDHRSPHLHPACCGFNLPFIIPSSVLNGREAHWSRSTTMNFMPNAAIAVTGVVLLAVGLCLACMMASWRQDARLQFLINLWETQPLPRPASGDQSETPQPPGTRQDLPERATAGASRLAAQHAGLGGAPRYARLATRERALPRCEAGACRQGTPQCHFDSS
jgi:hypothetical protein